jgi:hypothetical protein
MVPSLLITPTAVHRQVVDGFCYTKTSIQVTPAMLIGRYVTLRGIKGDIKTQNDHQKGYVKHVKPSWRLLKTQQLRHPLHATTSMPFPKHITYILLAPLLCSALTVEDIPELIPGPGPPSLASLNLITADLYNLAFPSSLSTGSLATTNAVIPFQTICGPTNNAYTNINNLITCYYYLSSLGR